MSDVCDEANFCYISWEGKCHIEDGRTNEWREHFHLFSGYAKFTMITEVLSYCSTCNLKSFECLIWSYILFKQEVVMDIPLGLESNSKNDNINLVNDLQLCRHINLLITCFGDLSVSAQSAIYLLCNIRQVA